MNKDNEEYIYDAFISYRHCEPDMFVAQKLHKLLETYKLPVNLSKKLEKEGKLFRKKITRIFRDNEELPLVANLEDPLIEALKKSEWLIVICSPRLKESLWCKKEIETFIKFHGRNKVLAVLVEGEPSESFPEELFFREIEIIKTDGSKELVTQSCEPLAANARASTNAKRLKVLKTEMLRLLAPMFNVSYDDLKQRHRERKIKRTVAFSFLALVVCLAYAIVCTFAALEINKQNEEIKKQNDQITNLSLEISAQNDSLKICQAENLAEESLDLLEEDRKYEAVETAYRALTVDNGIAMPYTDKARYALMQSLDLYAVSDSYKPDYEINTDSIVNNIILSSSGETLAVVDAAQILSFWSVADGKKISELEGTELNWNSSTSLFLDDERFLYANNGAVYEYNIKKAESKEVISFEVPLSIIKNIQYSAEENNIYVFTSNGVYAYQAENYSQTYKYESEELLDAIWNGEFKYLGKDKYALIFTKIDRVIIEIVDKNTNEVCFKKEYLDDYMAYNNCIIDENVIYIMLGKTNITGEFLGPESCLVMAYDMEKDELLWDREDLGFYGEKLCIIDDNGEKCLVQVGSNGILESSCETGELYLNRIEGDIKILWSGKTDKAVIYVTSEASQLILTNHTTIGFKGTIQTRISDISLVEKGNEGYFIVPTDSNRVVYYSANNTALLTEYTAKLSNKVNDCLSVTKTAEKEEIIKLGIPYTSMIETVSFDYDHEYIAVSYNTNEVSIYELSSMKEICSFNVDSYGNLITEYLGKDNEGNSYWASERKGYMISPDNVLIGEFEYLRAVDADKNIYIFGGAGDDYEKYSTSIYSYEELLEKAKEYLESL